MQSLNSLGAVRVRIKLSTIDLPVESRQDLFPQRLRKHKVFGSKLPVCARLLDQFPVKFSTELYNISRFALEGSQNKLHILEVDGGPISAPYF